PRVKDEVRRALSDPEMWLLIERAAEGGLRLQDLAAAERRLHVRALTSKSVHARDVTVPIETLKALDTYVHDHRVGSAEPDDPLFTDRHGHALTGHAIRKLFERLKTRTGIRDLCAHMLRHTWATNFHRSGSGSRFDMQVEGGWTTGRMVERYCKARPFEDRRKAPSPFTASRAAIAEKRPSEKGPSQQRSGLYGKRIA